MSSAVVGALAAAALALVATPYLARLTRTVPDDDCRRWWAGATASRTRTAWTGVSAVALAALGGAGAGWTVLLPALVAPALLCAPLVVIDVEHHRLPDRLTVPLALLAAAFLVLASAVRDDWPAALRAVEAAGVVLAAFLLLLVLPGDGFGTGDVKLGVVLGGVLGWFGWIDVWYGFVVGFVVGAVVALALLAVGRATMRSHIAFGPMLIVGPFVVLALAA
jgi:leader peptidase (prepilin peptidase) / N-methyltransferase